MTTENVIALDGKELSAALDKLLLVVPQKELSVYGIFYNKKRCRLVGHDNDRTISITCDIKRSSGEGSFCFTDANTLRQALKGRDEVTITFNHNTLEFKSGRLKGDLKLFEPSVATLADIKYGIEMDSDKSIEIDHDFFTALGDGVKISRLKDPYNDAYVPAATIVFDGKKLTVFGTDDYHLHIYKRTIKSKKTPPIRITIPTSIFSILDKIIKDDAQFYITEDRFYIKGVGLTINLPPIETEVSLEQIDGFINSLGKPLTSFTIDKKFAETYQSISAFFKKGVSTLGIAITDSKLFLKYQNDGGTVSDSLKIKSKATAFQANIDPAVFEDTYKNIRSNKEIEFSIYVSRDKNPTCYCLETEYGKGVLSAYGYFKE